MDKADKLPEALVEKLSMRSRSKREKGCISNIFSTVKYDVVKTLDESSAVMGQHGRKI